MPRIQASFQRLQAQGRKALIPYVTAGDPYADTTPQIMQALAEGGADIYPRLSPTSEWDVAAGHAVVTAAGGKITDSKGAPIHFGAAREDFLEALRSGLSQSAAATVAGGCAGARSTAPTTWAS